MELMHTSSMTRMIRVLSRLLVGSENLPRTHASSQAIPSTAWLSSHSHMSSTQPITSMRCFRRSRRRSPSASLRLLLYMDQRQHSIRSMNVSTIVSINSSSIIRMISMSSRTFHAREPPIPIRYC